MRYSLLTFAIFVFGCSQSTPPDAPTNVSLPKIGFSYQTHMWFGRINIYVIGKDSGLVAHWLMPTGEVTKTIRHEITPNDSSAKILIYRGSDMDDYLTPRGAARRPRPHETAIAGTITCQPLDGKRVNVLLENIQFESGTIQRIGPLAATLDESPPP